MYGVGCEVAAGGGDGVKLGEGSGVGWGEWLR